MKFVRGPDSELHNEGSDYGYDVHQQEQQSESRGRLDFPSYVISVVWSWFMR